MKMDQPNTEVKATASAMSPALEAHFARLFSFALKAQALADALNALAGDPEFREVSVEIANALSSITSAIAYGLDTPQRFEVAA